MFSNAGFGVGWSIFTASQAPGSGITAIKNLLGQDAAKLLNAQDSNKSLNAQDQERKLDGQ